jgi:hypothetical protein
MKIFKTSSMEIVIEGQKIFMFTAPSVKSVDRIYNLQRKMDSVTALFRTTLFDMHI